MNPPILKIQFADFWKGFDREDFITPILKKYFTIELSETPDILLCSTLHKMSNSARYTCPKIGYTAENHRMQDRGAMTIGFDHESKTNYYLPLWQVYLMLHPEYFDMLRERPIVKHNYFCASVISNGIIEFRNDILKRINSYKQTSNYGKYLNNTHPIEKRSGNWHEGKIKYFRKHPHKFMMACESSIYPGYCTEKLMDAFLCNSIPIYYGDTMAEYWFNPKAFIFVDERLIENIRYYDLNDKRKNNIMQEPIFNDENMVHENIDRFEKWFVEGVKQIVS